MFNAVLENLSPQIALSVYNSFRRTWSVHTFIRGYFGGQYFHEYHKCAFQILVFISESFAKHCLKQCMPIKLPTSSATQVLSTSF